MVSFDIMQAVFNAYQTIWRERIYLLRLAAVPFAIAYLNFIGVSLVDDDISPLRRSLFLMPAAVMEAWLICQFIRTLLTGERWPYIPPLDANGRPPPAYTARVRGLLSGMIAYVLMVLAINVFSGSLATLIDLEGMQRQAEQGQEPTINLDPNISLLAFLILMASFVFFKLFWVHIAFLINMPVRDYIRAVPGWMPSVHLFGLWLAASLPMIAGMMMLTGLVEPLVDGPGIMAFIAWLIANLFYVAGNIGITLAASTAATFALMPFLLPGQKRDA